MVPTLAQVPQHSRRDSRGAGGGGARAVVRAVPVHCHQGPTGEPTSVREGVARVHEVERESDPATVLRADKVDGPLHRLRQAERHIRVVLQPLAGTAGQRQPLLTQCWNCPNCKEKRDALKKLDISRLPPVLVIHFKRFYVDPKEYMSNAYRKKQTYIDFPLEELDMRQFAHCSSPHAYNLYAVSNHYGSMEGGHYTAYCKSSVYGK
ncbi:hypothetical protein HF086_011212 [Spodoptera exigua]|uniref:ubiquitinyl hydrolase 1 n=1 Tax=Spodoptera exigua TaxID=7107 RepID=A0A922SMG5_SPOEX|nr:hypothetical protein HF086_011212 [Spodoptera exigua]